MKRKRSLRELKDDVEFQELIKETVTVDSKTGFITVSPECCYAHYGINFSWKSTLVSMPLAHLVWFLTRGRWPKKGYHVDHINDKALDNRPDNLQELLPLEHAAKRRGRTVSRYYGKGKYGYGLNIFHDKRDDRFYVSRNISRGFGNGDLQGIKIALGGYDSLKEAEAKVNEVIEELKVKGLDYMHEAVKKRPSKRTSYLDALMPKMIELRQQGKTFDQIAETLGVKMGVVYRRVNNVAVKRQKVRPVLKDNP